MTRDGLNKEVLRILAVALLLVVAGCQTTPEPTPTPDPTTTNAPTTTATATATATSPTATATATDTPFRVNASFPNCTAVKVQSPSYEWVVLVTATGNVENTGNYSGENTFTADEPIQYVIVAGDSGEVEVENPDYAACVATPTPTPTSTPTPTATPTPSPTPTATPTPEPTPTATPEPTPTPTPRPELEEHKIAPSIKSETLGKNASITLTLTNYHETAVEFNFDILWYSDRDIMDDVTRTHLVMEVDETVRLTLEYQGNKSIEEIDYAFHDLDYAEGD